MNTMKHSEFMRDVLDATLLKIRELSLTKGEEYVGKEIDGNEHANFDRQALEWEVQPEKVLMIFYTKHIDAIKTWVRELGARDRRKLSEPIEGRIDDAILYLLLLKGMVIRRHGPVMPQVDEADMYRKIHAAGAVQTRAVPAMVYDDKNLS